MTAQTVGLIGIGSMGWPMGARVRQAGFRLTAIDAVPGRAAEFAKETGAIAAASNAVLACDSDVIITMLPTSNEVAQALAGVDGVLAGLRPGSVIVEMSSGMPSRTRELAEQVKAKGSVCWSMHRSRAASRAQGPESCRSWSAAISK